MPVFFGQMGAMIGGVLVSMAGQLVTERFIKRMVVRALEVIVKKTETPEDDKMLADAKQAWNILD